MGGEILSDDADGVHPVRKKQGGHRRKGHRAAQNSLRPVAGSEDGVYSNGSGDKEGLGHGKKEIRIQTPGSRIKGWRYGKNGLFYLYALKGNEALPWERTLNRLHGRLMASVSHRMQKLCIR